MADGFAPPRPDQMVKRWSPELVVRGTKAEARVPDYPGEETLRRFATEAIPELR